MRRLLITVLLLGVVITGRPASAIAIRDAVKATLPPLVATWFDRIAHDTSLAHPPIAMEHFARGRGLPTGPIYGRLAFTSKALDHDFARKTDVYLMPVDDYTAWFIAKLDLSRMFSDGGKEEPLDHGVIDCCVVFGVSDADGYFSFSNVQVGSYYILAIFRLRSGEVTPSDFEMSGWDGNGHNVRVKIPNETFVPGSSFDETFFYTREVTLQDSSGAQMGVLRPNAYALNGNLIDPL
jgi:hypothetical protein